MKQKDYVVLVFIVFFSVMVSLLLSNKVISSPKNRQQSVEVVEKIDSAFIRPDEKYFNSNSINTTQIIEIGDDQNTEPFNGGL